MWICSLYATRILAEAYIYIYIRHITNYILYVIERGCGRLDSITGIRLLHTLKRYWTKRSMLVGICAVLCAAVSDDSNGAPRRLGDTGQLNSQQLHKSVVVFPWRGATHVKRHTILQSLMTMEEQMWGHMWLKHRISIFTLWMSSPFISHCDRRWKIHSMQFLFAGRAGKSAMQQGWFASVKLTSLTSCRTRCCAEDTKGWAQ